MNSFKEMGLNPLIDSSLEVLTFTTPTPIQAQTIPLALQGRDILGSAQTGTGKTLAFAIPLVNRLLNNPTETALVLVPTRELAQQVHQATRQLLGPKSNLRSALLIGGEAFFRQVQQLRSQARIIVGTPGRIIDHLEQGTLSFKDTHFLVLDETDRMFDMGFEKQIEQIIKQVPKERQTLMFSATIPNNIIKTASRYLINPERVAIGKESSPVLKIKQEVVFVSEAEKEAKLIELLATYQESTIIFVKTKWNTEKLAEKLGDFNFKAIALHGDLRQNRRERVIASFRKGTYSVLVATDIAARGIDIPHVRHIVNFDLPQNPEDYIHRIGRTGRAGAEGFAMCLVTPKDSKNWKIIDRFANSESGITDSDRASLSERPGRRRTGGGTRFGGSDFKRGGDRGGSRGGDRRGGGSRFGGSDRPSSGRSFRSERSEETGSTDSASFERPERKPRFEKSFGGDSAFGGERTERPFRRERSSDSFSGDRKPHFRKSFDDQGGDSAGKPFERRTPRFGDSSDRPFRSNDGFKRDFKRNDSFGENRGGSDFRKKRFGDSAEGGSSFGGDSDRPFRPRRTFDGASDGGRPSFKKDYSSSSDNGGFKKRSSSGFGGTRKPFDSARPARTFKDNE